VHVHCNLRGVPRFSLQVYNAIEDMERAAGALDRAL
jgi:selenocysteine lyase/cysteine desulfurase